MKTIWKFPLRLVGGIQYLSIPKDARLLHVGDQFDTPSLWFEVDEDAEREELGFSVVGTGHPVSGGEYLGTAVGSRFVWHIYQH